MRLQGWMLRDRLFVIRTDIEHAASQREKYGHAPFRTPLTMPLVIRTHLSQLRLLLTFNLAAVDSQVKPT